MGRGSGNDEAMLARRDDPWATEISFDLFDAKLDSSAGPIEVELVESGDHRWLRVGSKELQVGAHQYVLSARLDRDDNGDLAFDSFVVSAKSGRTMPCGRFAALEAELLEIARSWACERTSL